MCRIIIVGSRNILLGVFETKSAHRNKIVKYAYKDITKPLKMSKSTLSLRSIKPQNSRKLVNHLSTFSYFDAFRCNSIFPVERTKFVNLSYLSSVIRGLIRFQFTAIKKMAKGRGNRHQGRRSSTVVLVLSMLLMLSVVLLMLLGLGILSLPIASDDESLPNGDRIKLKRLKLDV